MSGSLSTLTLEMVLLRIQQLGYEKPKAYGGSQVPASSTNHVCEGVWTPSRVEPSDAHPWPPFGYSNVRGPRREMPSAIQSVTRTMTDI